MAKAAAKRSKRSASREIATSGPDRDWQVREALSTIKRAEEIKNDPKMMASVRTMAKAEKATIDKLARGKS